MIGPSVFSKKKYYEHVKYKKKKKKETMYLNVQVFLCKECRQMEWQFHLSSSAGSQLEIHLKQNIHVATGNI